MLLVIPGWFVCSAMGSTDFMVGELMTLPVRAGVRVTQCALHMSLTVSARTLSLAGGALQSLAGRPDRMPEHAPAVRPRPARAWPARARPVATAPAPPPTPTPTPTQLHVPPPAPLAAPAPPPAHVSEEPELVAEVAEPGAEDGAGASVTIVEPWEGYDLLTAKDVVDRLANAGPAELAAIELYESTHRQRETVLRAVRKERA